MGTTLSVANDATFDGALWIGGGVRAASFSTGGDGGEGSLSTDTLTVTQTATVGSTLSVAQNATFNATMWVGGDSDISGDLWVGGAVRAASFSTGGDGGTGSLSTDTLTVTQNATLNTIQVSGSMECDVDAAARIEVCSASDGKNRGPSIDATTGGAVKFHVGGILKVKVSDEGVAIFGASAFSGSAVFNGNVTFNGDAYFNTNVTIDGPLTVSGELLLGGVRLSGEILNGMIQNTAPYAPPDPPSSPGPAAPPAPPRAPPPARRRLAEEDQGDRGQGDQATQGARAGWSLSGLWEG